VCVRNAWEAVAVHYGYVYSRIPDGLEWGVCWGSGIGSFCSTCRLSASGNWDLGGSVRIVRGLSVRLIVIGISYFVWLHFALQSAFFTLFFVKKRRSLRSLSLALARCVSELSLCCLVLLWLLASLLLGFFPTIQTRFLGFILDTFCWGNLTEFSHINYTWKSDWRTPHVFGFLSRPPLFYLYFTLHSAAHTHLNTGWLAFVVAWHLIHELRLASVRYNILAFPRVLCYLSSWYTTHRECQ